MFRPIDLKLDLEICFTEDFNLHENIIKTYLNKLGNYKKNQINSLLQKLKDPDLPSKEVSKLAKHNELAVRLAAVGHPNIDKDVLKHITGDDLKNEYKSVLKVARQNRKRLEPEYSLV